MNYELLENVTDGLYACANSDCRNCPYESRERCRYELLCNSMQALTEVMKENNELNQRYTDLRTKTLCDNKDDETWKTGYAIRNLDERARVEMLIRYYNGFYYSILEPRHFNKSKDAVIDSILNRLHKGGFDL